MKAPILLPFEYGFGVTTPVAVVIGIRFFCGILFYIWAVSKLRVLIEMRFFFVVVYCATYGQFSTLGHPLLVPQYSTAPL